MLNTLSNTIVARATPPGVGAIAIIRLSGSDAPLILSKIFSLPLPKLNHAQLHYGHIHHQSQIIDEVMVVWFKSPKSYTREHLIEIHCHGNPLTVSRILSACRAHNARIAEPGEFTKRAFLNGRLDLLQAEAVMDTITATSNYATQSSLSLLQGGLSNHLTPLKQQLQHTLAAIEVYLDYPEEELEASTTASVSNTIATVSKGINSLLAHGAAARMIRDGITVALVGRPNVGKSSLLNALTGRDRAIVTDTPGTTRDVLEEWVTLGELTLRVLDTAGIRDAEGVEAIGVARARSERDVADIVLWVLDAGEMPTAEDAALANELDPTRTIAVINKQDIGLHLSKIQEFVTQSLPTIPQLVVSALGDIAALREGILRRATDPAMSAALTEISEGRLVTHERHRQSLQTALDALTQAAIALDIEPLDIVALDLNAAYSALCALTGENADETLIDHIFAQFCVGK